MVVAVTAVETVPGGILGPVITMLTPAGPAGFPVDVVEANVNTFPAAVAAEVLKVIGAIIPW